MAKKLFVRFSTPEDEEAIFEFYSQNEHKYVAKRDPEVWRERIASGAVTLVHDEDGVIVASSISYPVTDSQDRHMWTEIGSTRVALDGIGLFKTLLSAQLMRAWMLEPPEDRFAAEIIIGNEHSKHVFTKNGATTFDIPEDMRKKVVSTLAPESKSIIVEWFQLGVEAMPAFAKHILDTEAAPKITHKETGEVYEIDFSRCILLTMFRDAVEKISSLDMGNPQQPDLNKGIKDFSKKFAP